jgi:ATP-binding cassette subfamily B protein
MKSRPETSPQDKRRSPLARLWKHTRAYRRQVVLASTFSIFKKIVDLAPPVLIGAAVDIVISQENSYFARLGITNVMTQLWVLAAVSFVVWGLESLFQYLSSILWRNLAQTIQHELRLETYAHMQNLEMAYFEDRNTGGLLAILNDDINQLERFLDSGADELIQVTTTVIVIGGIFFVTIPNVAWMALLPMPFVVWGSVIFQTKIAPRYAHVRERNSLLSAQLSNNLSGIATIKSFTAEQHEIARIRRESEAYRGSNRSAISLSSAFTPLIRMVIVTGFTAILVFGGQQALEGTLNVGTYSVLVFMTQRLLWPLTSLGTTVDLYQRAMASTDRVLDLLDTEPQILTGEVSLPVREVRGEVKFDNICFKYNTQSSNGNGRFPATIQDLNIHIPAGHTAAIVGATGSGKSTLVKLLLRLYEIQTGRITLDGVDLRDLKLTDLRRAIGFVSQDVFLFHGTVRENIEYGSFGASMEQVVEAAKVAEAHDFIMSLPDGYDTIVGERGQKLSGGERQRLSIARAVLKNPPVLILDEATSAVDNETEAAIQRSLEKIVLNRTTIMIAHRLSTIRNADRIFVLEKGLLQEQGTHEELLAHNGIYAALWRVQTGERARR